MSYNNYMFEIEHYLTEAGQDLIGGWLSGLQDNPCQSANRYAYQPTEVR